MRQHAQSAPRAMPLPLALHVPLDTQELIVPLVTVATTPHPRIP
jgi:hypothetical protein